MLLYYLSLLENENDKSLFTSIYEKYERTAYTVALHYLHKEYDAEDAVEDAWIWMINNFSTTKERYAGAHFEGFIITIVKHTSIDKLRKKKRGPVLLEDLDTPTMDVDAESADTSEKTMTVIRLISAMPPKDRIVIERHQIKKESFAKVGKMLKCSEDAARMRFNRAMEALKRQMVKAGYEG